MMKREHEIDFVMRDKVEGVEVTPSTIGLARFNEYNQQVAEFIAGSQRLKLDDVHVSIEEGSYILKVAVSMLMATALQPDLQRLARQDSLGEMDPRRADVVAKWQAKSKGNPELRYLIRPHGMTAVKPVELSSKTDYRIGDIVPWVKVEKYLFGTVVDMGGAQKANVHLRLEGSQQMVKLGTDQDYLKGQQQNRLYQKMLVRVEAEQHYKTGELRNLRLLAFEDYESKYDERALDRFAQAGKRAWADVPDAAKWVRQLRGGS